MLLFNGHLTSAAPRDEDDHSAADENIATASPGPASMSRADHDPDGQYWSLDSGC